MPRKLLLLGALAVISLNAQSIGRTIQNPSTIVTSIGAPVNPCGSIFLDVDTSNGNLYDCFNGAWTLIGGGSGPGGTAGGDLSGTYPNPTVVGTNGATLPLSGSILATNSSRQIITQPGGSFDGSGNFTANGSGSFGSSGVQGCVHLFDTSNVDHPVCGGTAGAALSANPLSSDNSTDVATTAFVKQAVSTLFLADSVAAATTTVLSNTPTYNNGTAGVGATLTAGTNGVLTIDGYTVLLNDSVLIKNQASQIQNGVYTLTTLGTVSVPYVLTRSTSFNTPTLINGSGAIPVLNGTANNNTIWVLDQAVTTIGTSAINYILGVASVVNVPSGGTGKQSFTINQLITGGTTTTGALAQVTGDATTTHFLAATGLTAKPAFRAIAAADLPATGYQIHSIVFNVDGQGSALTTGQVQLGQAGNWTGTIIGWSLTADQSGSVTVELDAHSSSAPPSAPSVPNTTSDKISASAPMTLSSAQTASGGATQVSTWATSRAAYDSFAINITAATTITKLHGVIWYQ